MNDERKKLEAVGDGLLLAVARSIAAQLRNGHSP